MTKQEYQNLTEPFYKIIKKCIFEQDEYIGEDEEYFSYDKVDEDLLAYKLLLKTKFIQGFIYAHLIEIIDHPFFIQPIELDGKKYVSIEDVQKLLNRRIKEANKFEKEIKDFYKKLK